MLKSKFMNKNNLLSLIYLTILILTISSCDDKANEKELEFIVYSKKTTPYNNLYATVYVSDTNWLRVAEIADSMVREYGFLSKILFYNDSSNVPILSDILLTFDKYVEPIASYVIPQSNQLIDKGEIVDGNIDLSFKLLIINDREIQLDSPYNSDYRGVNDYINFHKNYDYFDEQTKTTADDFIHLLLENKTNEAIIYFQDKIDMEYLSKIKELLLGTEWIKVLKSDWISEDKYNLWCVQRDFVKDTDTLAIKIHFDVNKSAEKIERVEYSYNK